MKTALITGITGQDGSYLTELLLSKCYTVHGLVQRNSPQGTGQIAHLCGDPSIYGVRLFLHESDLTEASNLTDLLLVVAPDEIYNLAAQSHVGFSFEHPEYTAEITGLGTLRLLEAIRKIGLPAKFLQASSSEMFGNGVESPQREKTPFHPANPYAAAKLYAYWSTVIYRQSYGFFACNAILFNHESPRRGEDFVTRKITRGVARIKAGLQKDLMLGNLDVQRDWGYAAEYVEAEWQMLQQPKPDDYVIGTGETHSVREFVQEAFAYVGLDWHDYVQVVPQFYRATEVDELVADAGKARRELGWSPKTTFKELVHRMVDTDLAALEEHN